MLIDLIAGKPTDLCKIKPVLTAIQLEQAGGGDIGYRFIFTGSTDEFDAADALNAALPNIFLEVKEPAASHYTAHVLTRYEKILTTATPDLVMAFGHSTGAMACCLAAAKIHNLRIAHIGSGLRTYNRDSGDEINRRIIDSVTDYHFPTAQSAAENLRNEGIPDDFIFFVGNPLADYIHHDINSEHKPPVWDLLQLKEHKYILVQLQHPRVAGNSSRLKSLLLNIIRLSKGLPVIISSNQISGRTLSATGIKAANLHIVKQPGVDATLYLAKHARLVITDTEYLQDETTIMQVPCITLLKSEARPETYINGYNEVTGLQPEAITDAFHKLFNNEWKKGRIPYLWDGKMAGRIISVLRKLPIPGKDK